MTRAVLLAALATPRPFCNPHVDPGPVPIEVAAAPATLLEAGGEMATVVVYAGSAHDPIGHEGLAWLTAKAIAGSEWSVRVEPELVVFERACDATDCLGDLVRRMTDVPLPPPTDAALARLSQLATTPDLLADAVLTNVLYRAHPYGHPPAGRSGVLALLGVDDVQRFRSQHYVRSTVAASVPGDQLDRAERALVALPTHMPPELVLQRPLPVEHTTLWLVQADVPDIAVAMGQIVDLDAGVARLVERIAEARMGLPPSDPSPDHRIRPDVRVQLSASDADQLIPRLELALSVWDGLGRTGPTAAELAGSQVDETGAAWPLVEALTGATPPDVTEEQARTAAQTLTRTALHIVIATPDAAAVQQAIEESDAPFVSGVTHVTTLTAAGHFR